MHKILMAAVAPTIRNFDANLRRARGGFVAARTRAVFGMYRLSRCQHDHDLRELMAMVAIVKAAEL